MANVINYSELYKLQDRVLDIVFKTENIFYLTGGTCLSRFYQAKRYSDDLDFFANNSTRFNFAFKNILSELKKSFSVKFLTESQDFIRIIVNGKLEIDFVNERVPHFGDVIVTKENYIIDNIENILSNKITALLCRDNPKDVFDIYLIWKYYPINWTQILESAHEKLEFNNEDLIIRLKTFPHNLLQNIKLIDKTFLDKFDEEYPQLIKTIMDYSFDDNSDYTL